ncbi:MAG: response regulator transcription factor [Clostridia bacterium]|nr:response regulator transcription factor [Clostridia bacterium]
MQKILIIEDNWELHRGIAYALEKENYSVCSAHCLQEAKEVYLAEKPELVLLDVNLPDGEGFAFCAWMKDKKKASVLFLTARDLEEDILKGYELGAEDYVTKPFSMKILLKRIAVILKRNMESNNRVFDDGFLYIDFDQAKASVNGREQPFTPTELRLLHELSSHTGQLLTYDILLERLWDSGGQFVDKHALAVNVNRLRKKIEDENHKYISNVYGMGYQWLDG